MRTFWNSVTIVEVQMHVDEGREDMQSARIDLGGRACEIGSNLGDLPIEDANVLE